MAERMQGALVDLLREIGRMDRRLDALQAAEAPAAGMATLAYAATIALDTTLAGAYKTTTIHATGAATINASTPGTAGARLMLLIVNDATSGKTITLGTNFISAGTLTGTASKAAVLSWISDGSAWYEAGRITGL